tara:strand:+ start:441 stop:860 length:420 start_codon:yes stop_codon:yes gene_type:complete
MSLDIDEILHALENDKNEDMLDMDYETFHKMKNDALQRLLLPRDTLKKYIKSLKYYRYIDELPELHMGSYIRWVNLINPENIKLTNGGVVCGIKVDDEIIILCRNKMNRMFQLNFSSCIIFQKLTDQENVILSALKFIQ